MAHTYTNCLVHCVFSTKNRQRVITNEMRERLWPFMGGIARSNGFTALEVGGYVDHAHMLIALPATRTIAKAMQEIKGGSSKFMNETFTGALRFEWQEGYGAFSVSASAVDGTIAYIRNQEEHHRVKTFEEEYIAFLKKNGISYDERYVFGRYSIVPTGLAPVGTSKPRTEVLGLRSNAPTALRGLDDLSRITGTHRRTYRQQPQD